MLEILGILYKQRRDEKPRATEKLEREKLDTYVYVSSTLFLCGDLWTLLSFYDYDVYVGEPEDLIWSDKCHLHALGCGNQAKMDICICKRYRHVVCDDGCIHFPSWRNSVYKDCIWVSLLWMLIIWFKTELQESSSQTRNRNFKRCNRTVIRITNPYGRNKIINNWWFLDNNPIIGAFGGPKNK